MPPEQFFGKKVDQRADIYAMGLIFYDMLLGPRRAQSANSALAEIKGRLKEAPPSPITIDPSVPEDLDRIISKCLEPDPDERYQTTAELAADLDRLDDEGNPLPVSRLLTRRMVIAAIGAVVLLIAGTWFMASRRAPPTEREPISVLIADFDNQTGDASFEGAVEQALTIAMEGAAFITAYPRPNAQRIAEQLQPGSKLDETTTRLVSRREGVSVILAGTIASEGDGYALSVRALDPGLEPDEGKPMAVAEIATDLRGDLGDTTPSSDQMAAAETFTAASLGAMQAYARGQDLAVQGKFEEALSAYQEAVAEDPEFGRAYSGMGVVYGNMRREAEAEESYQQAFQHLDRMSERERYRTLGGYYLLVSHNYEGDRELPEAGRTVPCRRRRVLEPRLRLPHGARLRPGRRGGSALDRARPGQPDQADQLRHLRDVRRRLRHGYRRVRNRDRAEPELRLRSVHHGPLGRGGRRH
jgi:tetratricopeptide (TPR) repeat protein